MFNHAKVRLHFGAFVKEVHELKGVKLSNDLNIIVAVLMYLIPLSFKHDKAKKEEKNKKLREKRNLLDASEPVVTEFTVTACYVLLCG